MPANPILEELYAVRRNIMVEHGDDLSAYLHAEFERLKAAGHPIADMKQRSLRCTKAARPVEVARDNQASPHGDK